MQTLIEPSQAAHLLLAGERILDVRAPIEFRRNSCPETINLPILEDDERHAIGICYRHQGQDAAIQLGERLVSGDIRDSRIAAWRDASMHGRVTALMCARGGLRSQIAQRWLASAGVTLPRVAGGYKLLRQYLMARSDTIAASMRPIVICGMTGVGKTILLQHPCLSRAAVDLEAAARHCGSGFGGLYGTQPSQANFENHVALELMRKHRFGPGVLLLEDESRAVGQVRIPEILFAAMCDAERVVVVASTADRIRLLRDQYVSSQVCSSESIAPGGSLERYLFDSLGKISRRLGGARTDECGELMKEALREQRRTGRVELHDRWILRLLEYYYDPMYLRGIEAKNSQISFRGNAAEVVEFLSFRLSRARELSVTAGV